jgi:hypothetical protein
MKKLYPVLVFFAGVLMGVKTEAQCPVGRTQSQLNWDWLDYLPSSAGTNSANYLPSYPFANYPYTQAFTMGPNRLRIIHSNPGSTTLHGENATHTGEAGSFGTGQDVHFVTTTSTLRTITIVFDAEVANLQFSLYDMDAGQRVTARAWNAANAPQIINMARPAGGTVTIAGSPGLNPTGTGPGGGVANNLNTATVNITVAAPIDSVVLSFDIQAGDFWLSDLNACVSGTFPNNWRNISRPFTGMPSYILTVVNSTFYMIDPATGRAKFIFTDPNHSNVNGMAYDPMNRVLYYTFSLTSDPWNNKTIYKYRFSAEIIGEQLVNDVTASLGIPTYDQGVESGSASFYDGYYYFGVESSDNSRTSGRENTVWRIDFDASQVPIRASQVYATRSDSTISGSPRLLHDWSDIGVTNNAMMYDFDGARNDSMYYHFNLMSGQRTQFLPNGAGHIGPKQLAIDWAENVYNMGGIPSGFPSTVGGFIAPYNYNGTINSAQTRNIFELPGPVFPTGSWGDCSEAFRPYCDFGDAPNSYEMPDSVWAPAVHERDTSLRIGPTFDREWLKQFPMDATGDGADEDGLAFVPIFDPSLGSYLAQVRVWNNTGVNARLIAWLDWNGSGYFEPGEAIVPITIPSSPVLQTRNLFWPSTPSTLPNNTYTYMRIRLVRASDNLTINTPAGYYDNGETEDYRVLVDDFPLSSQLLDFNATVINNNSVKLTWTAYEEPGLTGYELQRSNDSRTWEAISFVSRNPAQGEHDYTYLDRQPLKGTSYYRLKLVETNGIHKFSAVREVFIDADMTDFTLVPNPAKDFALVKIFSSTKEKAIIRMSDMSGKIIYSEVMNLVPGENEIGLSIADELPSGVYVVQLVKGELIINRKLVVNK